MVSNLTILFITISMVFAFALPVCMAIVIKQKYKASLRSFLVGCLVWLIFATILEQGMHYVVLSSGIGDAIQNSVWLTAVYGGIAAGIYEEIGRYLAMKFMLKKYYGNKYNSIMYGAGHGGFEVMFLLGMGMINNLIYAFMINGGQRENLLNEVTSVQQKEQLIQVFDSLINTPSYNYLLGCAERVSAVILHIALSVLVWIAVTKGVKKLLIIAIAIHAAFDAVTVILSRGLSLNNILLEIIIFAMAVIVAYYVKMEWVKAGLDREIVPELEPKKIKM